LILCRLGWRCSSLIRLVFQQELLAQVVLGSALFGVLTSSEFGMQLDTAEFDLVFKRSRPVVLYRSTWVVGICSGAAYRKQLPLILQMNGSVT